MNPLISRTLNDEIVKDKEGHDVYALDCANLPICKSYGDCFFVCLAGAYVGNRCSHADKMKIRILNDANPNAIYRPKKPSAAEIRDYVND